MNAEQIQTLVQAATGIVTALQAQNTRMNETNQVLQALEVAIDAMGQNNQQQAGAFSRTPLSSGGATVIDFTTREGKKFHEMAGELYKNADPQQQGASAGADGAAGGDAGSASTSKNDDNVVDAEYEEGSPS